MSDSAVYLQPAFLLQTRPYRESSLLLEAFTRDFGIVSILAKGVRKEKSKTAGVLQPFSFLQLSYLDKNELKILTQVEYVTSYSLQRLSLYCGFYVNELLQCFLHRHDPHPHLFSRYQTCLMALAVEANVEQILRYFELDLLDEAGYGLAFDSDWSETGGTSGRRYNFVADVGMVEDTEGDISDETLTALSYRNALSGISLVEAKRLTRKMLNVHLQGRALKSREVLAKIIKYI